jgi:hypothetical protein
MFGDFFAIADFKSAAFCYKNRILDFFSTFGAIVHFERHGEVESAERIFRFVSDFDWR